MKNPIVMITIDPSTVDTGYTIFENGIAKYASDIISDDPDTKKRVDYMIENLYKLIDSLNPSIVICEGLTVFNDIKTDSNLSDIIGAVKGFALIKHAWFDKLFPHEWRKLIAFEDETIPIKNALCKPWDIEKAKSIFPDLLKNCTNDNIADSALIGEAYIRLFGNDSEAEEIIGEVL